MAEERHENRLEKWARTGNQGSPPVHAATVILTRDGAEGLEVLMLRRNSKIAFGGMWVFPGGRVDDVDARADAPDDELAAARNAAVREAHEECGLEIPHLDLVPYSHWTPPPITPRRFLTWFFLAPAPGSRVVVDGGEIREHAWMSPADALARRDRQEIEIAPPTFVTLYELARWRAVEEALAAVRERAPERFETHIGIEDDGPTAMWHGDAGWAAGDPTLVGPRHRLSMHRSGWRYERGG